MNGRDVFVCENPDIVATAVDRLGAACAPLLCTDGMPSAAQRVLLQQLAAAGARMRYHGDYDWPGIRIGNIVIGRLGAVSWRFDAAHYRPDRGRPLSGLPVEACWDTGLGERMREHGVAVHEEALVDVLLPDLAPG